MNLIDAANVTPAVRERERLVTLREAVEKAHGRVHITQQEVMTILEKIWYAISDRSDTYNTLDVAPIEDILDALHFTLIVLREDSNGEMLKACVLSETLPTEFGEVKFMTLGHLFECMKGSCINNNTDEKHYSPMSEYDYKSIYYAYAINDIAGVNDSGNSTLVNLSAVDNIWYAQKHVPIFGNDRWDNVGYGTHSLFGGELFSVHHNNDGTYYFDWSFHNYGINSSHSNYWGSGVSGDTVIAVVHR